MPRVPFYTLAWSPVTETYELYQTRDREGLKILPESPAWFAWLEQVSSFAFVGKSGRYSARKEAKQRGDRYWSAYLTTGTQLTKKYLGKTADLKLARLEHIAGVLGAQSEVQIPPPVTLAVDTNSEVDATQRPMLAPQSHPLHPLLPTKLHVPRPRTHLVPRAHLVERLQQGIARQLTLVSAPAGFGKTTLLAQWLVESGTPVHLVLTTRADPPLPLARLRARGQLTEIRTADLRFGTAEAGTFLQEVMGLDLEASDIATLQNRTEGWIAGLQLAGLSLQGRTDTSRFLAAFSGSHRYVLDYLSEEVLSRQPAAAQQFLLHTCLLERLSGPLCDAVTAQEGSQTMLEDLERANLFVIPLDEERNWYRYHHLFAEVLRRHMQQREPTSLPVLHLRASAWYEQHELPAEAVQHALAVPDVELAARLIEPIVLPVAFQGQLYTVLKWMNALPEALIRTRPFLCVYYAQVLTTTNQLEEAEARLQEAEQGIQEEVSASQAQIILGWVLDIRADIALFYGDIARAISLAHQALAVLSDAQVFPYASALTTTLRTYLLSGEVTSDTEHAVAAAVAFIRTSDNLFATVSSICLLARLHILQGRLRQAAATFAQVAQVVPRPEVLHTMFSSLSYYFGLGDLLRECNDLEAAELYLAQGMALVKETLTVEPFVAILGYSALARLQQTRSNFHGAFAILDTLEHLAEQRHFPPHLMPQLAQGKQAVAIRWVDSSGISTEDDDVRYPRECAYLALARVRIAQARADLAGSFLQNVLHLLERLLRDAEAKERMNSVLEILVLRALAQETQGNNTSTLSTLERALVLAAPEGYIRLFVDEGAPMLALLRLAQARSRVPDYVATLLSAFGEQRVSDLPPSPARPDPLAEPLSEREREVLRLLLEGASNREIARRFVLSVNTVKRHVYNICGKFGVQSRTQAIIRARALHLL